MRGLGVAVALAAIVGLLVAAVSRGSESEPEAASTWAAAVLRGGPYEGLEMEIPDTQDSVSPVSVPGAPADSRYLDHEYIDSGRRDQMGRRIFVPPPR